MMLCLDSYKDAWWSVVDMQRAARGRIARVKYAVARRAATRQPARRLVDEHPRRAVFGEALRDVTLDLSVLPDGDSEAPALVRVVDHHLE